MSDLARVRLSPTEAVADAEVAWIIQLFECRMQIDWCLSFLREHYPMSRIVLVADGDSANYADIAEKHACQYLQGRHLMTLQNCHLYVRRLLEVSLAGEEKYLFKVDPDTRIWRRFTTLPGFSALFGTLETISEQFSAEIIPPNVQGGCIGLTRDVADEILSSGILTHDSCCVRYADTWARCHDMLRSAARDRFCDDFVISWAAAKLGVPLVDWPEIRSRWRRPVSNAGLRFAVTHPHKLTSASLTRAFG